MGNEAFLDQAHLLTANLRKRGEFFEALKLPSTAPAAGTRSELSKNSAVALLKEGAQQYLKLAALADMLNSAGRNSAVRTPELTESVMFFAALDVSKRFARMNEGETLPGGRELVSPEELALFILTHHSHKGELPVPAWSSGVYDLFQSRISGREIPTLSAMVGASSMVKAESSGIIAELTTAKERLDKSRKGGPSLTEDEEGALEARVEKIEKILLALCDKITDVFPAKVETISNATRIAVSLTPLAMAHGIDLLNSITSLMRLELGEVPTASMSVPVLVSGAQDSPAPIKVRGEVVAQAKEAEPMDMAALCDTYIQLRTSLVQLMYNAETLSLGDPFLREQYRPIWKNFAQVFGDDKIGSGVLLQKLAARPDCSTQVLGLCLAEMITTTTTGVQSTSMLSTQELFPLLPTIAQGIILGKDFNPTEIHSRFQQAKFSKTLAFFQRARLHHQKGDIDGLIQIIGTVLSPSIEGERTDAYTTLAALITLDMLLAIPAMRAHCKARPKIVSKLSEATTILQNELGTWSPLSSGVIAVVTQRISRHMTSGLSDYWGAKPLVEKVSRIVLRHKKFLHNPKRWEGLKPNRLFNNGYLLHGPGGSGKSYLLRCLAQEYELSILEIGKDDLMKRRDVLKKDGKEVTIAEVLDKVVEELRGKVKKSGADAGMLVLNEFEEMAPRKDRIGGDNEMLELTTALLRKFEILIPNTQDILICATANNIEVIEPAMIRPGRFGCKIEVPLPDKDGVRQIIESTLTELGQKLEIDATQWSGLLETAVGLTPEVLKIALSQAVVERRITEERDDAQIEFGEIDALIKEGRELSVLAKAA